MDNNQPITRELFSKRFSDLCLRSGLSSFPTDNIAQHILLKSVVLTLGNSDSFTEQEINERLKYWIIEISRLKNADHSTLRRMLVDAGYLIRNKDGSHYQVAKGSRPELFDSTIEDIDILEVLKTAREEIARRKQEYLAKQGK